MIRRRRTEWFGQVVRLWQSPQWTRFVGNDWSRELLNARLHDRLHQKQGRSIARWTLRSDGETVTCFIKRHYEHSRWRSLIAYLAPRGLVSDAGREWQNLQRAGALGIPTPHVLAGAEWRRSPWRLQSALVLEELPNALALHEAIPLAAKSMRPAEFTRWKAGLTRELVRLVRCLHDRGYFHQDLYLCHFFIDIGDIARMPSSWQGRVTLIDFHRLTRRRLLGLFGRIKDLAQLLYSSDLPGITKRDVIRFWRLYRTDRGRMLPTLIQLKARRYRRHNDKWSA